MAVDTKGLCLTNNKDPKELIPLITTALNEMILKTKATDWNKKEDDYKLVTSEQSSFASGYYCFYFKIKGEQRKLSFHLDCDQDGNSVDPGPKLLWSVSCWGESRKIVETVGEALLPLGPVYIDFNDCDELEYCLLGIDHEE